MLYVLGRDVAGEVPVRPVWSQGNAGVRRFDGFDPLTATYFEGNTTPWTEITWEKLTLKLTQASTDRWLVQNNLVNQIMRFRTEIVRRRTAQA